MEPKKSQKGEMKAVKWQKGFQTILIRFSNKMKKWLILIMRKQSVTAQALSILPRLIVTVDGPHPPTCLTACLLQEQLMSQPLASSQLGTFYTCPYFSRRTCVRCMSGFANQYPPASAAEAAWLTLPTQGEVRLRQLLAPCISCVWWGWKGSKGTFGNTSPSGS